MAKYGIGQPVLRFEDPRLLQGHGRYIHDVNLPGQAYAVFLRSPHAHAKIVSIDTEVAKEVPGVIAVYTGADYAADGLGMPKVNMPRKRPDGSPMFAPAAAGALSSTASAMSAIRSPWWSPRRWPRPRTRPSVSPSTTMRFPR